MAWLFHGEGSFTYIREHLAEYGEEASPPVDLKSVEEARQLSELLSILPSPGVRYVVQIGPMDELRSGTADALLKALEDGVGVQALLWARDIDLVPKTIVSRCNLKFCPSSATPKLETAQRFWNLMQEGKRGDALDLLQDGEDEIPNLVRVLLMRRDWKKWLRYRDVLTSNPTKYDLIGGLL